MDPVCYGGRLSLLAAVLPVTISLLVGGFLGILAGYMGGIVGTLIMRTMDVFYAFPSILLAIAICGLLGNGLTNSILALAVVFIPPMVRVAETVTTQARHLDFVEAARASGTTTLQVIRYHVLANVLGPILVYATSLISVSIILSAGLSFLGLGRDTAAGGMGVDVEFVASGDLRATLCRRPPRPDDLHHLDVFQFDERRVPQRHGREAEQMSVGLTLDVRRGLDPRDRGGPAQALLQVEHLTKYFPIHGGLLNRTVATVQAVDDVSFSCAQGRNSGHRRASPVAANPLPRDC